LRELAGRVGLNQKEVRTALENKGIEVGKGTVSAWWNGQSLPQRETAVHALETIFHERGVPYEDISLVALYQAAKEESPPDPNGQQEPTSPSSARGTHTQPFRARLRPVHWMIIGLVAVLVTGGLWWFQTRDPRTEFERALRQLDSPDATERRAAVRTIEELAPRSAAHVTQACSQLATLIRTYHKPPNPDPPMSKVPTLEERAPDAHAAVQAMSRLRCVGQAEGVHLNEVDLRKAQMRHTYFPGAAITWSDLRQVSLLGARLEGARFVGSNLDYANLEEANLADVELRGARMEGVHLRRADLRRADLGAELTSGRRVYLAAADLTGADLRAADLRGATLSGGRRIKPATLRDTRLEGTQLQDTVLDGVALDGATADASTKWPAGFDPVTAGVRVTP
jgi:uncharacterized protein YjbI with pentapeptide repeats